MIRDRDEIRATTTDQVHATTTCHGQASLFLGIMFIMKFNFSDNCFLYFISICSRHHDHVNLQLNAIHNLL